MIGTRSVISNTYSCGGGGLCRNDYNGTFTISDRHGIAPEANVTKFDVLSNQSYLSMYPNGTSVNLTNYDILNLSLGDANPTGGTNNFWKGSLSGTNITDSSTGTLIVKAAGNNNVNAQMDSVNNGLVASDYADSLLIVGATNKAGTARANYSNKAGSLTNYFVVDSGYVTNTVQGTSFAAPRVAGKAALIMHKFDNLGASDVATIIKETATDMGAAGIDNIYGYGKVNLTKAMSPVGNLN